MGASEMRRVLAAALLILSLAGAGPARADNDNSPEARLRAALKTATARIRDLEDQNAQLQAKQAAAERDRLDFTQKAAAADKELGELRKQGEADKTALDQAAAVQKSQGASIAKLQETNGKTSQDLQSRDADAKRLDAVVARMRPQLQSCEAKNAQLYKIGEEVLDLYDKEDIFDLASREPVTKLKRVEIENAMQDYEDKMRDNKIGQQ
jgi:chromosome segregation ATPase